MQTSPESRHEGSDRPSLEPGGEGGSLLSNLLAAPNDFTEALTPKGLLTISLLLSALLVCLATTALAT